MDAPEPSDDGATRSALEAERERLSAKTAELESSGDALDYDEGFADAAQVAAEQGENRAWYDQLRRELDDIEHALARVDDGTYGTCEVCGTEIGDERLALMPATRVCIEHA